MREWSGAHRGQGHGNVKNTFEVLPEGLTRSFLKEFGFEWTQISLLSGVLVSSFSLQRYVNPGAWAIAVIGSFGIVYTFRRQIGGNFPRTALIAGIGAILLLVPGGLLVGSRSGDVLQTLERWRTWTTLYVAFGVCIPLAIVVLSYRKQETLYGGPYPEPIQDAIEACIVKSEFYRVDQTYEVEVLRHEDSTIRLRVLVSYTLVNRTKVDHKRTAEYSAPSPERVTFLRAEVDGNALDIADRDYHTARGLVIPLSIPAGKRVRVLLEAEETFSDKGGEMFTAYMPTTALTVRIGNPIASLRVDCESLLPEKVTPTVEGHWRTFSWSKGVLPFSGFRLYWYPLHVPTPDVPNQPQEVTADA
jgi:hypothetical protein